MVANLQPIKFTKNIESTNGPDDISQLFENTEEESPETKNKRSETATCSTWFGDPELIVYKLFYLFFHAATALFAYLPLYYKDSLLLDHRRVGILMGIRPFCGFLGAPILGSFADKFNKYKSTLYTGLLTYIIVYLSITFVHGVPKDCESHANVNLTNTTRVDQGQAKSIITRTYKQNLLTEHLANIIARQNDAMRYMQPRNLNFPESSSRYEKEKPLYFTENAKDLPHDRLRVVFDRDLGADQPARTNSEEQPTNEVDSRGFEENGGFDQYWEYAPETAGEDTWPIDVYRKEPQEKHPIEDSEIREHIFLILLLLMLTAELIGSPILSLADTATLQTLKKEPYRYGHQFAWAAVGFGFMSILAGSFLHYTVSEKDEVKNCPEKMEKSYKPLFYSCCALMFIAFFTTFKFQFRTYERKETLGRCSFIQCISHFKNIDYLMFAFLALFTGIAEGLRDSFLFVHLIRLGATPLVLVVTTTVQSVSKVIFFYISPKLILKFGYFPMIYAGMLTSVIMFLYYSFLVSPWMVVPIELLAGLSSSCVWAALVSFVGAPPKIGATLQGIVHSLHIGLGRGIGGLFGGMILLNYGFEVLFRSFSLAIAVVVGIVVFVRYRRKEQVEPIWAKLWDYSPIAPNDSSYIDEE